MTVRFLASVICSAAIATTASSAITQTQNTGSTQPTTAQPPATRPASPVKKPGQLVNVKIEFTITDQGSGGPPVKRTVSLIVADGETGSVRSQPAVFQVPGNALQLNVDARPELAAGNKSG